MINRNLAETLESKIRELPIHDISYGVLEESQQRTKRILELIKNISSRTTTEDGVRLTNEFIGLGPIEPLVEDQDVTEIIITSAKSIWYEKGGKLIQLEDHFLNNFTFHAFVDRVCQEAKAHFNLERPVANGKFRDFRLHIASQEITQNSHVISLRRHPKSPWTFEKLVNSQWCSQEQSELIQKLVSKKENFLVIGNTGSGKTSLLNACLMALAENERVVIIEDTSELTLSNSSSNKLITRFDAHGVLSSIDLAELVKQSLRMRPDRLVIGEIRGSEAKDLLMALSTGHGGSFSSLHAASAKQALIRLEMLIQLGAPKWSLHAIRNLICLSLQYILVVEKNPEGRRRLQGIHKIHSVEETGILLEALF